MNELDQILRLRRAGVCIDYYVMDAFWYSTNGGYREFRSPHWPNGPDRWLKACRDHQIKPDFWVASNVPFRMEVLPEWRSSMDATSSAMCMFDGGFLPQFIDTLRSRPVICQYDKAICSDLSWAVGEVRHHDLDAGIPITIRCSSVERQPLELRLEFYAVNYD
jgi:hypothetical protein